MIHERLSRCAKARVLRKWCGEAQREFFGLSFQVRAHTKDPKGHCGHFGSFSCIQHEHESLLAAILTICQFTNRLPHAFPFAISGEKLRIPQSEQAPTGCCGDHRPFHMPVTRIARAPHISKRARRMPALGRPRSDAARGRATRNTRSCSSGAVLRAKGSSRRRRRTAQPGLSLRVIINALTTYSLGYSHEETLRRMKAKTGHDD